MRFRVGRRCTPASTNPITRFLSRARRSRQRGWVGQHRGIGDSSTPPRHGRVVSPNVSGDTSAAHAPAHCLGDRRRPASSCPRGPPAAGPDRRTRTALQPRRRPGFCQRRRLPTLTPNASAKSVAAQCRSHRSPVTARRHPRGRLRCVRCPIPTSLQRCRRSFAEVATLTLANSVVYDRFAGTAVSCTPTTPAPWAAFCYAAPRQRTQRRPGRTPHHSVLPITEIIAPDGDVLLTVRRDDLPRLPLCSTHCRITHRNQ